MALIWGGAICFVQKLIFMQFCLQFCLLMQVRCNVFFCNIIIFILLLIIYNCTTHKMHSVCVKTKHHFPGWVIWIKVDVVFSMESFDCGDFNFSAEPHWQRGRFRSCTLTTVCFVSWIAALHREFHQLLDLMDLTLTQGLRLSQRKILKRFDSVCNLIP